MSTTEDLVFANLGLVHAVAKPWCRPGMCPDLRDDIYAAGRLGLVEAAASFDPDKGCFSRWAWRMIRARIVNAVRLESHPNLSVDRFRLRSAVRAHRRNNPEATAEEIAAELGTTAGQVQLILDYQRPASLDAPSSTGFGNLAESVSDRAQLVADEATSNVWAAEASRAVHNALERLPERQREPLRRYFGIGTAPQPWAAIATEEGQTPEAVRTRGMRGLKALADDPELLKAVS